MPIRTYTSEECYTTRVGSTSQGGFLYSKICYPVEKPILDWEVSPASILKEWHPSQPIPSTEILTVQFPELNLLTIYKKYKGFRNYARIAPNDYAELLAPDGQELDNLKGLKHNLRIHYNNFNKLPENENIQIKVTFGVIATEEKSGKITEIDLPTERKEAVITLRRTNNTTPPQPKPNDRLVLNMVLNIVTKELTGDTTLNYNLTNPSSSNFALRHSFTKDYRQGVVLIENFQNQNIYDQIFTNKGLFNIRIRRDTNKDLRKVFADFSLSDEFLQNGKIEGLAIDFSKPQVLTKENNLVGEDGLGTIFIINLTIINDTTVFHIDKKLFNYVIKTDKKERAEGIFTIKNPNHLTFTINNSDFLEVTEFKDNGKEKVVVKFRSQSSELMTVGEHKGWFKVTSSSGSEQVVNVNITVQTDIDFTTKNVYFCLDRELTHVRQTSLESEFITVTLTMEFNVYGRAFTTVQTYDYVFFDGKATVDIGQEIQNFFVDIAPTLEVNTKKLITPKELFKATKVSAVITETNFKGKVFRTHSITDLYYLPGKKPKAYPYLTQCRLRSTYSQSLISISALTQEVRSRSLGQIGSNLIDLSAIKDPIGVANFSFLRSTADATYGATAIISKETLSLEPKPEPNSAPISALFQNQNYCPDWFSFAGEYEALVNYEHTLADNVLKSEDYKAQVKTKRTYKLNTGWLFPEEIEVLWELIKSPVCFLHIGNEWLKAIPITQKPLSFDNTRNLHSFVVEFQLSSND